jgi:hypothetical protein
MDQFLKDSASCGWLVSYFSCLVKSHKSTSLDKKSKADTGAEFPERMIHANSLVFSRESGCFYTALPYVSFKWRELGEACWKPADTDVAINQPQTVQPPHPSAVPGSANLSIAGQGWAKWGPWRCLITVVSLAKLIVAQLFKKFAAFYGRSMFSAVFTGTRGWTYSSPHPQTLYFNVPFNIILQSTPSQMSSFLMLDSAVTLHWRQQANWWGIRTRLFSVTLLHIVS